MDRRHDRFPTGRVAASSPPISQMIRSLLLLLILCAPHLTLPADGWGQGLPDGIRYHFKPGEGVRYRVVAVDSIIIFDRVWRTVTRRRAEVVQYRCNSILPNGNMLMTVELTEYAATERLDTMPQVTRTTHPWVGHPRVFVMSPTGRRLDMIRFDSIPGSTPGGPFAPLALPYLGDSVAVRGNDVFTNRQWMFDNVFPPVGWDGTTFRSLNGMIDTLGERLFDVELTETAVVHYRPIGRSDSVITRSRINGAGRYLISPDRGYPVGGTYDLIADIDLTNPHGESIQGRHLMSTIFELYTDESRINQQSPKVRDGRSSRNPRGASRRR